MNCKICGKESENRICKDCQYHLNHGADEETIKRMLSNDPVKEVWKENEEYSEKLAEAYYESVIENYKKTKDSKENFGYNTFIDGIRLGLDIVVPMLDKGKIIDVQDKIESMLEFRNKQKRK